MKLTLAALLFIGLLGCAGYVPYAQIDLAYQLDKRTDWYERTSRGWQGSNPFVHFELGLDMPHGLHCALHHKSHLQEGGPFNSKAELYSEDFRCGKKWGGR